MADAVAAAFTDLYPAAKLDSRGIVTIIAFPAIG